MSQNMKFLAVGLSPAIQKTVLFTQFTQGNVNRSIAYHTHSAGKCVNVCRVLTQAGSQASCYTVAGKENRSEFESLCQRDGLDIDTIETGGRVRVCTTILETERENYTEMVVNEPEQISSSEEERFYKGFLKKLDQGYGAVILSGSRLPGFSHELIPNMVREIKSRNLTFFADYKGIDLLASFISSEVRPDYIKINEEEFTSTFGDDKPSEITLKEISSQFDNCFIISRGPESTWVADRGNFWQLSGKRVKAVNPIGSGDSMTAGIAQAVMEGLPLRDAVMRGCNYGTLNAQSLYPGWIRKD